MATKTVVETIYGKHSKYEIVKVSTIFSTTFTIYKDGEYFRSGISSLADAVAAAQKAG